MHFYLIKKLSFYIFIIKEKPLIKCIFDINIKTTYINFLNKNLIEEVKFFQQNLIPYKEELKELKTDHYNKEYLLKHRENKFENLKKIFLVIFTAYNNFKSEEDSKEEHVNEKILDSVESQIDSATEVSDKLTILENSIL